MSRNEAFSKTTARASHGEKSPVRKIPVENINSPGKSTNVDAAKYLAMRQAVLAGMALDTPMTVKEIRAALEPHLDQALFPNGGKAGWWLKCVQLDLEAKSILKRAPGSPVRLSKLTE